MLSIICKIYIFKFTHEIISVFLFKIKGGKSQQKINIKMQSQGNKYFWLLY